MNYKKQMGALITGQMFSLLLNFLLPLILVRILTKNDYGVYAQFNVILSFCTVFLVLVYLRSYIIHIHLQQREKDEF